VSTPPAAGSGTESVGTAVRSAFSDDAKFSDGGVVALGTGQEDQRERAIGLAEAIES
jgi:hypothetical protein